jgi:hypothetical protein
MAEDKKNVRAIALDHQSTVHLEQKLDVLQRTVTTAHVENKLKGISRPMNSSGATSGGAGQSSGNKRK